MANPTDEAIAKLRSRVSEWTRPDAEILAALNEPTEANPEACPQVAAPVSSAALLPLISPESTARLLNYPNLESVLIDIRAGNVTAIAGWAGALTLAGVLTEDDVTALGAALGATIPDPDWQPLLSWAELNLGRPVDAEDLAAAREGM